MFKTFKPTCHSSSTAAAAHIRCHLNINSDYINLMMSVSCTYRLTQPIAFIAAAGC